jgi:hypothetical protein
MLQKSFVSFVKWAPRKPERIAKTQNLQRVLTKLLRILGENSAQKALRRDGAQKSGTRRREGFVVNASDAAKYCLLHCMLQRKNRILQEKLVSCRFISVSAGPPKPQLQAPNLLRKSACNETLFCCRAGKTAPQQGFAALFFRRNAHHVREAAVDISDLAGNAASQVRQQEGGGIADVFDGHVAAQRSIGGDDAEQLAEILDA